MLLYPATGYPGPGDREKNKIKIPGALIESFCAAGVPELV